LTIELTKTIHNITVERNDRTHGAVRNYSFTSRPTVANHNASTCANVFGI